MNYTLRLTSLFAMVMLLSFCGDGRKAGGVWDEAGNALAVRVLDSNGSPVALARVRVIPIATWSKQVLDTLSPSVDSALTDSQGRAWLTTTSWPAQIEVENQALVGQSMLYSADSSLQVHLKAPSSLSGTLVAGTEPRRVHLAGTSYHAEVLSNGNFEIHGIPEGRWTLVQHHRSSLAPLATTDVLLGEITHLDTLVPEASSPILLEDFEDSHEANRWHPFTGGGWWFCGTDGSSQTIPSDIMSAVESSLDIPNQSRVAHFRFEIDDQQFGKYALCGFDLGISRLENILASTYDFSNMDSLTLWIKGTGTVKLQAIVQFWESVDSNTKLEATITLPTSWTQISLRPQDFVPIDSTYTWNETAPYITSLIFMENVNTEFWIDHIEIHGITPQELYPQLRNNP